ncbi:SDR family oxidoreductase [Rhodobacteraceae bacterium NNCM2]|nr:SDR family oxidoreductase [Coraliihabitans acroporae]
MTRLAGKTALVTGGGTGIGLATAQRFIEEGAFVYIAGRRQEVLDKAVAALGPNARAIRVDVSRMDDLDHAVEVIGAERGTLDILFSNAGGGEFLPLGEITEEHYHRTFDINLKGTIFLVQKALPLMRAGGSIILTGSTTGVKGEPAFSIYSASKAAIRNLARTWASDLRGTGIRINVVSPGPTGTETLLDLAGDEGLSAFASSSPLERISTPGEVAAAVAFLASADSSSMTGSEIFVDGGYAQV